MSTFREQWIADGFPWCDTCGEPAVLSEFYGNLHASEERRFGVMPHADNSGHAVTMRDWSEEGMRRRAAW